MTDWGPDQFAEATGVSRETLDRLRLYVETLGQWQRRINLVGPRTLREIWHRHILDCWQLVPLIGSRPGPLIDMGAGAGLPGLILAIAGVDDVHLVESDSRKAAFLRESARILDVSATIHTRRVEGMSEPKAQTVVARALAPLDRLLALSAGIRHSGTLCVFPKGRDVERELTEAHKMWIMRFDRVPSRTDSQGTILLLHEVAPHGDVSSPFQPPG
ncbi:16S rRNA (guanine(527)-N(7))-methyltransferase RsmG [Roseospirillum parvum]|uniref:Ribosomal RNA small subunit methyltransferase G n=1 Tax=Roseospirillum parvum TaxID=83401 RepID=A0A1G8DTD0_9PROT|nr:16S rRNA (guanine(527)-N(7))-methyltransferase RsmG [Roseospirillum parvum]SDH60720.1 16S rRNA (guanine527-N7)-methyltransferase [Roseospirillum parvum]